MNKLLLATLFVLLLIHSNAFTIQPKVINGQLSTPGDFPHYVFLQSINTDYSSNLCGGSLISDRFVAFPMLNLSENWVSLKSTAFKQTFRIGRSFFFSHWWILHIISINPFFRWILTAAHCVGKSELLVVSAGIEANGRFEEFTYVPPENSFVHPNYNNTKRSHDLGMYSTLSLKSI